MPFEIIKGSNFSGQEKVSPELLEKIEEFRQLAKEYSSSLDFNRDYPGVNVNDVFLVQEDLEMALPISLSHMTEFSKRLPLILEEVRRGDKDLIKVKGLGYLLIDRPIKTLSSCSDVEELFEEMTRRWSSEYQEMFSVEQLASFKKKLGVFIEFKNLPVKEYETKIDGRKDYPNMNLNKDFLVPEIFDNVIPISPLHTTEFATKLPERIEAVRNGHKDLIKIKGLGYYLVDKKAG